MRPCPGAAARSSRAPRASDGSHHWRAYRSQLRRPEAISAPCFVTRIRASCAAFAALCTSRLPAVDPCGQERGGIERHGAVIRHTAIVEQMLQLAAAVGLDQIGGAPDQLTADED